MRHRSVVGHDCLDDCPRRAHGRAQPAAGHVSKLRNASEPPETGPCCNRPPASASAVARRTPAINHKTYGANGTKKYTVYTLTLGLAVKTGGLIAYLLLRRRRVAVRAATHTHLLHRPNAVGSPTSCTQLQGPCSSPSYNPSSLRGIRTPSLRGHLWTRAGQNSQNIRPLS